MEFGGFPCRIRRLAQTTNMAIPEGRRLFASFRHYWMAPQSRMLRFHIMQAVCGLSVQPMQEMLLLIDAVQRLAGDQLDRRTIDYDSYVLAPAVQTCHLGRSMSAMINRHLA